MNQEMNSTEILTARYALQNKPEIITNSTIDLLLQHKSTRKFLSTPLDDRHIQTLVAAAQSASTSSNLHQWSVIAVTDTELKSQICNLASGENKTYNQYIKQAPAILLWVADLSRNHKIAQDKGEDLIVHDYLDSFVMATVDATLAAQNSVIAAESLGLGICYIGATRNKAKELATLLNLPQYSYVVFGVIVGYPDPENASNIRPRPEQQVVLHYNKYDQKRSIDSLKNYEKAYHQFRHEVGLFPKTWEESVISSTKFSYMDGRENLRNTLLSKGFKLK